MTINYIEGFKAYKCELTRESITETINNMMNAIKAGVIVRKNVIHPDTIVVLENGKVAIMQAREGGSCVLDIVTIEEMDGATVAISREVTKQTLGSGYMFTGDWAESIRRWNTSELCNGEKIAAYAIINTDTVVSITTVEELNGEEYYRAHLSALVIDIRRQGGVYIDGAIQPVKVVGVFRKEYYAIMDGRLIGIGKNYDEEIPATITAYDRICNCPISGIEEGNIAGAISNFNAEMDVRKMIHSKIMMYCCIEQEETPMPSTILSITQDQILQYAQNKLSVYAEKIRKDGGYFNHHTNRMTMSAGIGVLLDGTVVALHDSGAFCLGELRYPEGDQSKPISMPMGSVGGVLRYDGDMKSTVAEYNREAAKGGDLLRNMIVAYTMI